MEVRNSGRGRCSIRTHLAMLAVPPFRNYLELYPGSPPCLVPFNRPGISVLSFLAADGCTGRLNDGYCAMSRASSDVIELFCAGFRQERLKTVKGLLDASRLESAKLSRVVVAKSRKLNEARRDVSNPWKRRTKYTLSKDVDVSPDTFPGVLEMEDSKLPCFGRCHREMERFSCRLMDETKRLQEGVLSAGASFRRSNAHPSTRSLKPDLPT